MNPQSENPDKGDLLRRSEAHRELLEADVKQITQRSQELLNNALVIGGALAVTYFLVRGLSGASKPTKSRSTKIQEGQSDEPVVVRHEEPGIFAHVGNLLAAQAAGFLLSIAREKLLEFLQSRAGNKEQ